MPTEARNRAERCRMRAEECLQLAGNAADPLVKKHYEQIAENYLSVASAEESLADNLERSGLLPDEPGTGASFRSPGE